MDNRHFSWALLTISGSRCCTQQLHSWIDMTRKLHRGFSNLRYLPNHKMQSGNGWLAPPLRTVFPGIPLSDRSRDSWENWTPGEGKRQREAFTLSEGGFDLCFFFFVFFKLADLWTNLQQKKKKYIPSLWQNECVDAEKRNSSSFCPLSRATVLHLRLSADQRCSTAPWATGSDCRRALHCTHQTQATRQKYTTYLKK